MKKIISFLSAITLAVSMAPLNAIASSETKEYNTSRERLQLQDITVADLIKLNADFNNNGSIEYLDCHVMMAYFTSIVRDGKTVEEGAEEWANRADLGLGEGTLDAFKKVETYGDLNKNGIVCDIDDIISFLHGLNASFHSGDVNCDGAVDGSDATIILKYYAEKGALTEEEFYKTDEITKRNIENFGDISGDGTVDGVDATLVLKAYAERDLK